jgi:hypothetical protein
MLTFPEPMISVTSFFDELAAYFIDKSFAAYARIVRLEQGNLDAFIGKIALLLGKVEWCVVRRGMPRATLVFCGRIFRCESHLLTNWSRR